MKTKLCVLKNKIKFAIKELLRVKLLKILDLPETFISCDVHYRENTEVLVVRYRRKTGTWEVIADYQSDNKDYRSLINEISQIAKKYNVSWNNVVMDKPLEC